MIFPKDISQILNSNKRVYKEYKRKNIILFSITGAGILYFVLDNIFVNGLGVPLTLYRILYLAVALIVFAFIYTIYVFDIDAKREEYSKQNSDMFGRFLGIKDGVNSMTKFKENYISIFEYKKGGLFTVIKFRYGDNNPALQNNADMFFINAVNSCLRKNLTLNIVNTTEDFRTSKEFKAMSRNVNNIANKRVSIFSKNIFQATMHSVNTNSKTDCVYLVIKAPGYFFKPLLESVAKEILVDTQREALPFRDIEYLSFNELITFFTDFYTVETIDINAIKIKEVSEELKYFSSSILSLYSIETVNDEVHFNTYNHNMDKTNIITDEKKIV